MVRSLAPVLLACALVSAASPARSGPAGVDLLSAGASAIRIGLTAAPPELIPAADASGRATLRMPGWLLGDGEPGSPQLPMRVVMVAVPPTGPVSVRSFGTGAESRAGVELEIVPAIRGAGPEAERAALERSRGGERARLLSVSWLRNQRVASVAVLPVEYDAASRSLTSYGRIEIEVAVTAAAPTVAAEPVDAFEGVYSSVLVNYEQGRAWRRPAAGAPGSSSGGAGVDGLPLPATNSIFTGHEWVKIAVQRSGFYRVNYGQLRALHPFSSSDSIPFDKLRLYSWPGRPILTEGVPCDACDYRQVAIGIEDFGGDGKLSNNQDAFYFHALGPSDWADRFDPAFPDSAYIQNPYELNNYYFLSFDRPNLGDAAFTDLPARIPSNQDNVTPFDDGTENEPVTFTERLRFETDSGNEYQPSLYKVVLRNPDGTEPWAWEKFMWRSLTGSGTFLVTARTPGADPGIPARMRVRAWGNGTNSDCVDPNLPHLLDVVLSSAAGGTSYDSTRLGYFDQFPVTALRFPLIDTLNTLKIRVPLPVPAVGCRFDQSTFSWMELHYARRFQPDPNELWFESPGNGNAIYRIGPFQDRAMPRMFDVTDPFAPREMVTDSALILTNTGFLPIEVNETGRRRYAILPGSGFIRPAATDFTEASGVSRENLRSTGRAADHIIIYYDGFQLAADSLAAWRTTRLPLEAHGPPYHVTRVPVSAVYDQFSGGRTDPAAIRAFLRAAFYNWRQGGHAAPSFVTLYGDGSFDYRNLLGLANPGLPGCLMPSFENNIVGGVQYATDDWMLNVDDPVTAAIPDFFGARVTAGDAGSAMEYLQRKLFMYERSAPTGPYRNRVMFIADDDQQGDRDDPLKWIHLQQTSALDSVYTPDHVDRSYVYLHTYPDGPGRTKPAAKADIKNTINGDGVAMFNYIGHGSPFKLSDENVLIDVDAGTFTNATKLPLFVAASCDVGKFNDPRVQSLGERLLLATTGGTIGVISATELAYSSQNVELNNDLYTEIFRRDPGTGHFSRGVSHALLAAKLLNSSGNFAIQNNQKYQLLGDAGIQLNLPRQWVEVGLFDAAGTAPVTEIRGGQTITFQGQVVDRPGGVPVPYTGVADLLIEDSQPRQTSPPCAYAPLCQKAIYDFRAGAIFRGDVLITGGIFRGQFVVPLEAVSGPRGKVRAYVAGLPSAPPQIDGVGSIRMQVSPGTAPGGDDQGPVMSLSFAGGVTSVKPDATLRIELSDPAGILTTGHTIQNGIVVTLDDNTTARTDVTSSFRYSAGSYTTGTATFVLPNLAAGTHNIKVSAADNLAAGLTSFNHRSTAEITFDVVSAPPVAIRNAYLFPNPTESGRRTSGGQFVIEGPGDSVNVLVRLYTISGRMIRELKTLGGFGQVQITWDGLDAEGYPLANGTYLFKVYVNGRDERGRSTARQKASREGRFVILNH